jgi:hypothetical protein
VVSLAKPRFADLNGQSFADSRARVHIADAWEFLQNVTAPYDVILCDFTTPRRAEDTRVMTRDCTRGSPPCLRRTGWRDQRRLAADDPGSVLVPAPDGPRRRSERPAVPRLYPVVPGSGVRTWAFLLAGHRRLRRADLKTLTDCPVTQTITNLSALGEMAAFSHTERMIEARVRSIRSIALPAAAPPEPRRRIAHRRQRKPELPALDGLLSSIPILHPYHTRVMVESLAEQVVGSVQALDLRRLVDALLLRAVELPASLRGELQRLREFLTRRNAPHLSDWNLWAHRLFASSS